MKNLIILTIISFFLNSCSNAQNDSFEGVLTYNVSIEFKKEMPYADYIIQKYGGIMEMYFSKNGDIKQLYTESGKMGFDFIMYSQKDNEIYAKWRNLDTLYWYNAKENVLDLVSYSKGKPEIILGKTCQSIVVEAYDSKGQTKVIQTYIYDNSIPINPKLYKNYNDAFFSQIISETNAQYMKLIMDFGDFTLTRTIMDIERKQIDDEIFTLPKNIPRKEM